MLSQEDPDACAQTCLSRQIESVQNPYSSAAYKQSHDVQINCTPQLTFYADTMDFCAQLSLYEAVLVVVYLIFATVGCLTGLAVFDKLDFFGFYKVSGCNHNQGSQTQAVQTVLLELDLCCVAADLQHIIRTFLATDLFTTIVSNIKKVI